MNKFFNSSSDKDSLGQKFRQKRVMVFNKIMNQLPKPVKNLNIGGYEEFWVAANYQDNPNFQITIINLTKKNTKYSNLMIEIGDATNLARYQDSEFDVVFSNSIIEHLYTKESQIKME